MNWGQVYWADIPVLFMDFETSGFSGDDRICEVALVVARGGEILKRYHTLVNPECRIDTGATSVHGITDEMVVESPTFEQVFPEFRSFFYMDIPWVSHNMPFDMRMLDYSWPHTDWPRGIPSLCSLAYSKKHPTTKMRAKHKLVDLANYFMIGYDPDQLHEALYDTEILAQIIPKMMGGRTVGATMSKYNHEWRQGK